MADFLRLLLDSIAYIWPLRMVKQWERAGYYVFGRWRKEVGPGVWPVVPWFCEVYEVSVAEEIVNTPKQDVTLSDGSLLVFSASATIAVVDVKAALNAVQEYDKTAAEAVEAVVAERLAEVDAARLEWSKRTRLFADLRRWVQDELTPYGVELRKLRFRSFVVNARAHRLIIDAGREMV